MLEQHGEILQSRFRGLPLNAPESFIGAFARGDGIGGRFLLKVNPQTFVPLVEELSARINSGGSVTVRLRQPFVTRFSWIGHFGKTCRLVNLKRRKNFCSL
jgi:hypothetical protein